MSNKLKQAGFGSLTLILVLVVAGLIGFIGWRVYEQNKSVAPATETENTNTPIENAEDLDAEADALNSQDIDEQLDTAEIDETIQ
jgi:cytoskeletal protein RodZ